METHKNVFRSSKIAQAETTQFNFLALVQSTGSDSDKYFNPGMFIAVDVSILVGYGTVPLGDLSEAAQRSHLQGSNV
jgi:hypothetical protein